MLSGLGLRTCGAFVWPRPSARSDLCWFVRCAMIAPAGLPPRDPRRRSTSRTTVAPRRPTLNPIPGEGNGMHHRPPPRSRFKWRPGQLAELFGQSAREFVADNAPKQSAALAYYTLFALGPLLLIAVAVAGFFFGATAARDAVTGRL